MAAGMISNIVWFPHEEKTKHTIQYVEAAAVEDMLEVYEVRGGMEKVKLRSGC